MFCFVLKFLVAGSCHYIFSSESLYLEGEHFFLFPLNNPSLARLFLICAKEMPPRVTSSSSAHGVELQGLSAKQWPLKMCLIELVLFFFPFFLTEFVQLHVCFQQSGQSSPTQRWCQQTQEAFRAKKTSDLRGSSYGCPWLQFYIHRTWEGKSSHTRMHRAHEIRRGCQLALASQGYKLLDNKIGEK